MGREDKIADNLGTGPEEYAKLMELRAKYNEWARLLRQAEREARPAR